MKLFISYAKQQRSIAEELSAVLSARAHDVFFDRDDLPPGVDYRRAIRQAAENCDVFVFLVSPESVAPHRYTLTELEYRQKKVPNTSGTLLPVVVKPTLLARIPPYIRTVTLHFPQGNLSSEVADAIDQLTQDSRPDSGKADPGASKRRSEVFEVERIAAYCRLWELTRVLPRWPRAENVPYSELRSLSASLRDWYFVGGGGLFLSRPAQDAHASIQNTLQAILSKRNSGPVTAAHYEEVREVCSALRTQLAKDVGARD